MGSRPEKLRRALRHDLRNPLAVILGRCEILSSGAMGKLNDGQARSVDAIQRNAERLVTMLDTLADSLDAGLEHAIVPEQEESLETD